MELVSHAERELVRYMPGNYYQLANSEVGDAKLDIAVQKIQDKCNKARQTISECAVAKEKVQVVRGEGEEKKKQLVQEIGEIKKQIAQLGEQRQAMLDSYEKERRSLENDMVQITFDYQLLVQQLERSLHGGADSDAADLDG